MFNNRKKFRSKIFNMLDSKKEYDHVQQQILDDRPGWVILEEKGFTNEMGEYLIFMKWTEPKG